MTLHEAIIKILLESNNPLKVSEVASIINKRNLYRRSDGNSIPDSQIHARINKYPGLFKKVETGYVDLINRERANVDASLHKMLQQSRNNYAHGTIGMLDYLLIPLCFFYKRVIDNPTILPGSHIPASSSKLNTESFLTFLKSLVQIKPDLNNSINNILTEFKNERLSHIETLLTLLNDLDLSEDNYSVGEFSRFYLNTIRSVAEQNFRYGLNLTPDTIAELIAQLAVLEEHDCLINPGMGIGTLPVFVKRIIPEKYIYVTGDDMNMETYLLAFTNLLVNHIDPGNIFLNNTFSNKHKIACNNPIIISNPPINAKFENYQLNGFRSTNVSHLLFLEKILEILKNPGRAVILLPDSFLFRDNIAERELRSYILKNRILEGIISLPAGILSPYSGIKTSILILNSIHECRATYLIDAGNRNLYDTTEKRKPVLENEKIINLIKDISSQEDLNESRLVNEPYQTYVEKYYAFKRVSQAESFSVNRIIHEETNYLENDPELFPLEKIVEIFTSKRTSKTEKFVNISDLNTSFFDISLDLEQLSKANKPGNILNTSAILIGKILGSQKPTYYDGSEPITVSPNIFILRIKDDYKNKVVPEYLVYQFASKEFFEQLENIAQGTTSLRTIRKNELLKTVIRIPGIKEQLRILRRKKEQIVESKLKEVRSLETKLGIVSKTGTNYLDFIEHELGNIAGGATNNIKVLSSFLKSKKIDLDQNINERKGSSTVKEVVDSLQNNFADITNLTKSIRSIIDIAKTKIIKEPTFFANFINQIITNYGNKLQDYKIKVGIEDKYSDFTDIEIPIQADIFTVVIRNFINNTIKHGYTGNEKVRHIVFSLSQDDDFYNINLINDGKPFPEDFGYEKFVEFGSRSGETQGSGIGGYLMDEIVRIHSGELNLINDNELIHLSEGKTKVIIKVGVHLQIKLTKVIF